MSSIKKNFLYNAGYQILNLCLPLIVTPYLSRALGADGIGIYSYSYSIAHFFAIFILLGLNNYGCREIAKRRENKVELSKTFWSIYFLQITLGVLLNGLYFGYCFLFANNKLAAWLLGLYTLSACFDVNWFFFGLEKFRLTAIRNFSIKIVKTILIFLLVKGEQGAYLYCLIMAGGFLLSQLILWPEVLRSTRFYFPQCKEVMVHVRPNLFLFVTTIAVSIFKYMDKIMLGTMSNVTQVGFYESAERILAVPIAFISALGTVMLPRMTNLLSTDSKETHKYLHISILFAMFASSVMSFGIMGVSKEFVPLFYGEGYDICVYLYLILLPSCVFLAFANVIRTQYLLPHQMDREYVVSAILGAVVNLLLNAMLIKSLGAVGVSIGTLVAEAVVCFYQSSKVMQRISLSQYIYESLPLVLSGAIMFVVLYFWDIPQFNNITAIALKIVVGAGVYFASLFPLSFIFKVNYIKRLKIAIKDM